MFYTNSKLLVVMAHPDDAEILCLGTILKCIEANCVVNLVVASSGNRGLSISNNCKIKGTSLVNHTRCQETIDALANTGVIVRFLDFDDGNLRFDINLISQIESIVKELQPEVIITHYVDNSGFDHQDHTAVGMATLNVSYRASSVKLLLQPQPHCLNIKFNGNFFVDITDVFTRKIEALQKHFSQAGKYYLDKDYHLFVGKQNALTAGYDYFAKGLLFERFVCNKLVLL